MSPTRAVSSAGKSAALTSQRSLVRVQYRPLAQSGALFTGERTDTVLHFCLRVARGLDWQEGKGALSFLYIIKNVIIWFGGCPIPPTVSQSCALLTGEWTYAILLFCLPVTRDLDWQEGKGFRSLFLCRKAAPCLPGERRDAVLPFSPPFGQTKGLAFGQVNLTREREKLLLPKPKVTMISL